MITKSQNYWKQQKHTPKNLTEPDDYGTDIWTNKSKLLSFHFFTVLPD